MSCMPCVYVYSYMCGRPTNKVCFYEKIVLFYERNVQFYVTSRFKVQLGNIGLYGTVLVGNLNSSILLYMA